MPATTTGRQASPAKANASPTKTRTQPMRSARLRSPSPFSDASGSVASAVVSQTSSPSKTSRRSPKKQTATSSTPPRRSTRVRERSQSVVSDAPSAVSEEDSFRSDVDVDAATVQGLDSSGPEAHELSVSNSHLAPIAEEDASEDDGSRDKGMFVLMDETSKLDASSSRAGPAEGDVVGTSASSSEDSDSDSGSDSDTDSATDSSSDAESSEEEKSDEDEAGTMEDLDALLKASEQAYKSRSQEAEAISRSRFEDNQDIISFDDGREPTRKASAPKQMALVAKAKKQIAKSMNGKPLRPSATDKVEKHMEALANGTLASETKMKTKSDKSGPTTAGSLWFDMPEFGASPARLAEIKKHSAADAGHSKATGGDARLATAEQLRKEVQAIRLRNALDPKRFYRSSAKSTAMPKFAQLGKIIASPLEPKAILSRQERGRTVVEELIRDAEAASYAKRKFSESQASHRPDRKFRGPPPKKRKRGGKA